MRTCEIAQKHRAQRRYTQRAAHAPPAELALERAAVDARQHRTARAGCAGGCGARVREERGGAARVAQPAAEGVGAGHAVLFADLLLDGGGAVGADGRVARVHGGFVGVVRGEAAVVLGVLYRRACEGWVERGQDVWVWGFGVGGGQGTHVGGGEIAGEELHDQALVRLADVAKRRRPKRAQKPVLPRRSCTRSAHRAPNPTRPPGKNGPEDEKSTAKATRTSFSERPAVEALVVHGGLIRHDVAARVVAVPARALRADERARVQRGRVGGRLAEEAGDAGRAAQEGRHPVWSLVFAASGDGRRGKDTVVAGDQPWAQNTERTESPHKATRVRTRVPHFRTR